ncbi:hypothetical protein KSS87_013903 [Heliosperma pusillum]|nr:hypothetical protein KSS87_013903 [Heliosperma pusillum]
MSSKVSHVDDVKLTMLEEGSVRSTQIEPVATPVELTAIPPSSSFSADVVVSILQKLIAEVLGTYFLVFLGCGAIVVDKINKSITHTGICVTWGLIIMIVVYTFEHISCHFNPAVTVTYAILRGFPWLQYNQFAGAAIGMTVLINALVAGSIDESSEEYWTGNCAAYL